MRSLEEIAATYKIAKEFGLNAETSQSFEDMGQLIGELADLRAQLASVKADRSHWARLSAERGIQLRDSPPNGATT